MFKKILISLAVAIFVIGAVPTIQVQAASGCTLGAASAFIGTPTIRNNNVNIRSQTSTASSSLGQIHRGARVRVTHVCGPQGNTWLRGTVQSGTGSNGNSGVTGWIRTDMFEGFGF